MTNYLPLTLAVIISHAAAQNCSMVLPASIPAAVPLLQFVGNHTDPAGRNYNIDTYGFVVNGKRVFSVGGEFHPARVPAAQWREQLLRMKAGGLDVITMYMFWIHYEESEGNFTFLGRRDLRTLMSIVAEVGLQVMGRIGPWGHGECRNGGFPDWLLARAEKEKFTPRSTDPGFLNYVSKFYSALSEQLKGFFWKDGGPIITLQLDNETNDWKYLLALRDIALSAGLFPAWFSKTAWPPPSTTLPTDFPLLEYSGGYPDVFWTSDMVDHPSGLYHFTKASIPPTRNQEPIVNVELGGGMAASYKHRPLMIPADMPTMILVHFGLGARQLGYYMYHGGNNPHSLLAPPGDAPETTLQESSFTGYPNDMPSASYDFFAPLGEFGQIRPHFHSMRRFHIFLAAFGSFTAPTVPSLSEDWWAVRSNGSAGIILVNNHVRLASSPARENVRFLLTVNGTSDTITVPSYASPAVTIPPDVWFLWPFNFPVGDGVIISWATAQMVTKAYTGLDALVVLVAIDSIAIQLAVGGDQVTVISHVGNTCAVSGGAVIVLCDVVPSTSAALVVKSPTATVTIVVLPSVLNDSIWSGNLAGIDRVFISNASMVIADGSSLLVRTDDVGDVIVAMFPPLTNGLRDASSIVPAMDGVFTRYSIPTNASVPYDFKVQQIKQAGPPRNISKKAPTAEQWRAAAVYQVTLQPPTLEGPLQMEPMNQLRLRVRYAGDAARCYYNDVLLTDNWYTGYADDGGFEIGLSYLQDENPGLMDPGANITIHILPMLKTSVQQMTFVDQSVWPTFSPDGSALELFSVEPVVLYVGNATVA